MTTSSEGPPLYTEHLPMNRLLITTATPLQWHSNLSVSQLQRHSSFVKAQFWKIFLTGNLVGFISLKSEWNVYNTKLREAMKYDLTSVPCWFSLDYDVFHKHHCLFVCSFCLVFSNLFIFIVIVMRCHHKHVWRVVKLKPSVHGVKYPTLDLDFLSKSEFIVNYLKENFWR